MWQTCRFWLARSQHPQKDQIQTFPSSPALGWGQLLGADEVSRRGWLCFGESSAGDTLPRDGSLAARPTAQEQRQDLGRDVQGSLPSWQRSPRSGVTPEPPRALSAFIAPLRSSQEPKPGPGTAQEWPFQPSSKNIPGLGWLGCRRDTSHPILGRGLGS